MSDWGKRTYGSAGYNALRDLVTMEHGADGDLWGTTQGWRHALADVLWHHGYRVPAAWEYRHGAGCDGIDWDSHPDAEIASGYDGMEWDGDDMIHLGTILGRYAAWLRLAGRDY